MMEKDDEGVLTPPEMNMLIERYTPQRKAEFLLSSAVDAEDYQAVVEVVRGLGIDPETILHQKPYTELQAQAVLARFDQLLIRMTTENAQYGDDEVAGDVEAVRAGALYMEAQDD